MDIPYLGWLFKVKATALRKINLLVFLTPHIVRSAEDLEEQTIRKRLEIEDAVGDDKQFPELADYRRTFATGGSVAVQELEKQAARYPLSRMRELEEQRIDERSARTQEEDQRAASEGNRYGIWVATYLDEEQATQTLTTLLDAGYDGTLVSSDSDGRLVFSVQLGHFDDLREAERTGETLDAAYGYTSSVTVLHRDEP